jgi:uncharacterized protein
MWTALSAILLISSFGWLQISAAYSASFNCEPYLESNKCPEAAICSDRFLSSQDEYMATLFFRIRNRLLGNLMTKYRDFQREWLAKREACGCNQECLEGAYNEQIKALTETLEQM